MFRIIEHKFHNEECDLASMQLRLDLRKFKRSARLNDHGVTATIFSRLSHNLISPGRFSVEKKLAAKTIYIETA